MKNVWIVVCKLDKCLTCKTSSVSNFRFEAAEYLQTREKARNFKKMCAIPQKHQILGPYALY